MTDTKDLPSDVMQTAIITRYEIEKSLQSRGFVGMMGLTVLVVALMTVVYLILDLDFPSDSVSFLQNYTTMISLVVIVGAIAFSSGSLSSEFEKRTGLLMFPQPVKRSTYAVGKYLSGVIMTTLSLGVFYLLTGVLSFIIVGDVPVTILLSFGLSILYAAAACSVTSLFSSVLRTNTASIVATVLTFLMVFSILEGVFSLSDIDPTYILTSAADVITYALQDPYPVTYTTMYMGGMMTMFIPTMSDAMMVFLAYTVLPLVAALAFFKRRQF